jgi:hypothetical protein
MQPIETTSDWQALIGRNNYRLVQLHERFVEWAKNAPPTHLKLEDMWSDIERLINTIAHHFTDKSCPALHTDELVGEGMLKLAKLLDKGYLEKMETREDWFAFFRTAINNHIRGQVHRHRFTIKRTGIRPPEKHLRHLSNEPTKPIEISLDDEEAHLQVGELQDNNSSDCSDFIEEGALTLTPLEELVFRQEAEANPASALLAEMDAWRGKMAIAVGVDVDIKIAHKAAGLGMTTEQYVEIVNRIQPKLVRFHKVLKGMHREDSETEHLVTTAIANLEQTFSVQVPKHFEPTVVKRLFTLLARRYIDRVNADVKIREWLMAVGAKIPELRGPTMTCFGILYNKGNRVCEACSVKGPCSVEAANFGLGEMLLHPEVLGARQIRVATLGAPMSPPAAVMSTPTSAPLGDVIIEDSANAERDDEIMNHLNESFCTINIHRGGRDEIGYRYSGKGKIIFCVSRKAGSLALRFSSPTSVLKGKLETVKNGHYLPKDASAAQAIELIDIHAKAKFV